MDRSSSLERLQETYLLLVQIRTWKKTMILVETIILLLFLYSAYTILTISIDMEMRHQSAGPRSPSLEVIRQGNEERQSYDLVYLKKPYKYYSQCEQDKNIYEKIMKAAPGRPGKFIDIGASNGERISNTKFFEESLKWKGICIEPNPEAYAELVKNRPDCINVNMGVGDRKGSMVFLKSSYPDNSAFREYASPQHIERLEKEGGYEEIIVEVDTLENILKIHDFYADRFDYLSLDCQGCSERFLKQVETKIIFDMISIEMNDYERNNHIVKQVLADNDYDHILDNCAWDFMYRHRSSRYPLPLRQKNAQIENKD
eukprot:TRINITY_DN2834_c0_g1_i1.p1 TRINITY_DN2834_c0_g1~~TRINITY_DN2834_c0_g1_i1.p1  ORF type:complete len:315 (-),score=44.94 TRINITY_DN2834_c0_g1_i1:3-947(-)